jgi:hypothetical protein
MASQSQLSTTYDYLKFTELLYEQYNLGFTTMQIDNYLYTFVKNDKEIFINLKSFQNMIYPHMGTLLNKVSPGNYNFHILRNHQSRNSPTELMRLALTMRMEKKHYIEVVLYNPTITDINHINYLGIYMFCQLTLSKDNNRQAKNSPVTEGIQTPQKSYTPLFKEITTKIEGLCDVNYIPMCVSSTAGGKHKKITRAELLASAATIGIKGRSRMNMAKLTEAIKAAKSSKKRKNK